MAWVQAWPTSAVSPAGAISQQQANNLWIQQFAEVDHDFLGSSGGIPLGLHKKASFEDAVSAPAIPTSALGVLYALTNNSVNRLYWKNNADPGRELVLCQQGSTNLVPNNPSGGLQNIYDFTGQANVAGIFIGWRDDATQWAASTFFVYSSAQHLNCINGFPVQTSKSQTAPTQVTQAYTTRWWDGTANGVTYGVNKLTGQVTTTGQKLDNIMKLHCIVDINCVFRWMWFGVDIGV